MPTVQALLTCVALLGAGRGHGHVTFEHRAQGREAAHGGRAARSPPAFVLSLHEERFNATSILLSRCGLNVTRVWPLPPDEPDILDARAFMPDPIQHPSSLSMLFSTRFVWASVALDPSHGLEDDEYFLFFEDDASLDAHVDPSQVKGIIHAAAEASRTSGFFYLGMGCQWKCAQGGVDASAFAWSENGTEFSRCTGFYTHAFGMYKWRALWLWDEMRACVTNNAERSGLWKAQHTLDTVLFYTLRELHPPQHWPVLAGSNLTGHQTTSGLCSPQDEDDGFGLFYQASARFPSMRLGREKLVYNRSSAVPEDTTPGHLVLPRKPFASSPFVDMRAIYVINSDRRHVIDSAPHTTPSALGLSAPILHVAGLLPTDATVRRLAALTCAGIRCSPLHVLVDTLARSLSHRLTWMRIMVDCSLRNADFVLVLEAGVALPQHAAMPTFLADVRRTAGSAQEAGIFWLDACRPNQTEVLGVVEPTAAVPPCLRGYGIFKWRAAWLWDVLQAKLTGNATFHTRGADTNTVSLEAHLSHGLALLGGAKLCDAAA